MTSNKLIAKLRDREYRRAFVASQIDVGIPFQIRAMMKARGWTQKKLAENTGMLQPRISGLITPGKTKPNIQTLIRVAEAFDCGLMVRFVRFSDLARWAGDFDPEEFNVQGFPDDEGLIERKEPLPEDSIVMRTNSTGAQGSRKSATSTAPPELRLETKGTLVAISRQSVDTAMPEPTQRSA